MEKYDVVIIGAGPGGLNCAYHLKDSGKRVLVLEQAKIIGPKVCAGGIPRSALKYLNFPEEYVESVFEEVTFESLFFKTTVTLHDPLCMIERKKLGEWQCARLEKSTVAIRTNSHVTAIGHNYVVVNGNEQIGFDFLVGADGSNSIVRRHLNIKNDSVGIGMQYLIKYPAFNQLKIIPDSLLFPSWYGWIFPHAKYVSVGCGGDVKCISAQKLRNNLEKWLRKNKVDFSSAPFEALSLCYKYNGFRFGSLFLVGEAAGLVSGLTGEGIYPALLSGEDVAQTIMDPGHISRKIEHIVDQKRKHENFLEFIKKAGFFRILLIELIVLLARVNVLAKKGEEKFQMVAWNHMAQRNSDTISL